METWHPCQSEQQGGMHPPGDTARGRGVCSSLPTSAAFRLMPLVPGRTKSGDSEPEFCSPSCVGPGQALLADPVLCSALAAEQPAACVTS